MDDLSKAYLALGLKAGASLDEIKQTYRDLVKVWHPDRFGHDERLRLIAQDKLKEINGAYEFLQAYSFDASIAPDQATTGGAEATSDDATSTEPPPAPRSRVALWVTLGVLVLAMIGTAAIFFSQKGRGKNPARLFHPSLSPARRQHTHSIFIATTAILPSPPPDR
jgi:hypothetical protein